MARAQKAIVAARLAALRAVVDEGVEARPGVYRMTAEDGAVLYVGKSKNLRARLLGYFRSERREKSARILRRTHQIAWEYTPSEFAALLLELSLIKRHRPPLNVMAKRDPRQYAFIRITTDLAPRLAVARGGAAGDGVHYGPFIGPHLVEEAVHELTETFGLRDCADHVPMGFTDRPALVPLGRTPGCVRHEIKKCLAPCIAACSARAYADQVDLARAFLEGDTDGPIDRFRREMDQASRSLAYERAALYRDKIRRLERLRDQLGHIRIPIESLSFVYPVPGFAGDDRVYLIRRGAVRAERRAPQSTPDRFDLQRMIDAVYRPIEPAGSAALLHEIDQILLVSAWFRRFPDELSRTWMP